MKVILAFDIARTTGVAVMRDDEDRIESWTIDLPIKAINRKITHAESFLKFCHQVEECIKDIKPDVIAFEDLAINAHSVKYMSGDWIRLYCGLRGILLMLAELYKVSWIPVTVQQIKKIATDNGNAKKDEVFEAAIEKWHDDPPGDNNEADARWCALVAKGILDQQ